jgi:glycosyltransferase involved in cell wall biosynthesis
MELILSVDECDQEYGRKLEELAIKEKQMRISLISSKGKTGLSEARNKAIEFCQGDWILILDSDDIIDRTAVASLVDSIGLDTVFVYSDHARVSSNLDGIRYVRRKAVYHQLLRRYAQVPLFNPLYSSVYISHGELIRKDAIKRVGGFKKEIGEKPPVWIRIFEMFGFIGITHVPKTLYYYRENKNGICARKGSEVIRVHEQTFLESIRKYNDNVARVSYIGRISPFMAKHFGFYDQVGGFIKMPYIDYGEMRIKDEVEK